MLLKLNVGCRNVSYRWCLSLGIGSIDDFDLVHMHGLLMPLRGQLLIPEDT